MVIDKKVVGIVCDVCRSSTAQEDPQYLPATTKSKGTFISRPQVRFGSFVEVARSHEFGSAKVVGNVLKFRKSILEGKTPPPNTLHMRTVLNIKAKGAQKKNIKQQLTVNSTVRERNFTAMSMLLAQLHRIIKRRDSPFASLKDTVDFNINVLGVEILKCLLNSDGRGISHGSINNMINAIYYLTLLGIYFEMAGHLSPGEKIIFGGMIDMGSKIRKTKEYAGVGAKIISMDYIVTRVIGFVPCATKDGLTLTDKLISCLEKFNSVILTTKNILRDRFPVKLDPLPLLQVQNMNSLGVDGACISKKKMINKRILEYNPRCLANWCGDHRASLVAGDSIKGDQRHKESHNINMKVYELVNASSKFKEQFNVCQINCGDALQFKAGKPVSLGVTGLCTAGRVLRNSILGF